MLRDSVAADRVAGRIRVAPVLAALVAAIAVSGCGIKGPLRLPTPPPQPAPATAPAPTTTPAAPDAGSTPVPTAEPEQPPPRKP